VLATGGGNDKSPAGAAAGAPVTGVKESTAMLAGVPQSGKTLGDPKAPVTMIEFADLQCPFCKEYSLQTLPRIVQDYVRAGKVRLELHLLTFLGEDSVRGAAVANAAALQDKLWNFTDLFYFNQGEEKTGYATDAFLRKIADAVPGLDADKAFADRTQQSVVAENAAADALAGRYGVTGTPSFVVGPTGGDLQLVDGFDLGSIKAALDGALKQTAAS
jgi:protein-disulfide isomerase